MEASRCPDGQQDGCCDEQADPKRDVEGLEQKSAENADDEAGNEITDDAWVVCFPGMEASRCPDGQQDSCCDEQADPKRDVEGLCQECAENAAEAGDEDGNDLAD